MTHPHNAPTYFLVTCFGNSASTWFAKALNSHPDIVCSHGPNRPSLGLEYKREQTPEETANAIPDARAFLSRPISDTFREIEEYQPGASAYGSVQGYRIAQLAQISKKYPDADLALQCVNLIRHPVTWVMSTAANYIRQAEISLLMRHELLESAKNHYSLYTEWCEKSNQSALCWNNLAFFAACLYMHTLAQDFNIAEQLKVPFIKKEDITEDREKLRSVIQFVTANTLNISTEYLDKVMSGDVVNSHQRKKPKSPEEQWGEWNEHQRKLFKTMASSAKIAQSYETIGYQFDFTERRQAVVTS